MLLTFPALSTFGSSTKTVRSGNRSKFYRELGASLSSGWEVESLDISYRKTLFGGFTSYCAVVKKGDIDG